MLVEMGRELGCKVCLTLTVLPVLVLVLWSFDAGCDTLGCLHGLAWLDVYEL